MAKKESDFYQELRKGAEKARNLELTRLENSVGWGTPDLLIKDERELFHFIELKRADGLQVKFETGQVSWLTRHRKTSSWVIVRKNKLSTQPQRLYVYHASDAVELEEQGLFLPPRFFQSGTFNWKRLFKDVLGF